MPGVAATVSFEHLKRCDDESHHTIDPTDVVPVGPQLDLARPHGRNAIGREEKDDERS